MEAYDKERVRTLEAIISICQERIKEMTENAHVKYGPHDLLLDIADLYEITVQCMKSNSRQRECVIARDIFILFCLLIFDMTFEKIGAMVARDHSSVSSSLRRSVRFWITNDKIFHHAIDKFCATPLYGIYFSDISKAMKTVQDLINYNHGKN